MGNLLEYVRLFFVRPKELFFKIKKYPNINIALVLLVILLLFVQLPIIKPILAKYSDAGSIIFSFISSFVGLSVMIVIGIIINSYYTLLLCRLYGSKPIFKVIFTTMVYCRIPTIISSIVYAIISSRIDVFSIFYDQNINPLYYVIAQRLEPFSLWVSIMEILGISIIAEISYFRSFIIVFSYMIIGGILPYFFGFKAPVLS